ncbi:hypothetical protein EMCRGX_G002416 [Ephydatia muelleri]
MPPLPIPLYIISGGRVEEVVSGRVVEVVSGRVEVVVSGRVEEVVSGRVEEVVSGRVEEVVSGRVEEVVSGRVEVVVSGRVEEVVSGRVEEVVSGRVVEVVSGRVEVVVSGRVEEVVSGRVEEVVSGRVVEVVSGRVEVVVSGRVEEVVSGRVEEVVSGRVEEVVSGRVEEVVSGRVEEVVSGRVEEVVFTSTCSQLLESMLLLRRLLNGKPQNWRQLGGAIDEVILQLFSKEHLPDFTSALEGSDYQATGMKGEATGMEGEATGEESSDRKRSATSYVKVLLHTLRSMVEAGGERREAVYEASSLLFKCFLDQNRKENTLPCSVEFQFLFKLLSLLGHFNITNVSKGGGGDGTGDVEKGINKEAVKKLLCVMMPSEEGEVCSGSGLDAVLQCLRVAQEYEVYQVRVESSG